MQEPGKTAWSQRWVGVVLIVVVGLLQLHLPHYLAESSNPADYATLSGLVLVATMVGSVLAALMILIGRRAGWRLGIAVATASFVLDVVQETVGLPGLEKNWWEPTRLLSLLLAAGFIVVACRRPRSASSSSAEGDYEERPGGGLR